MRLLRVLAASIALTAAAGPVAAQAAQRDTAVFAGGCFWGVEAVFEHLRGVHDAVSGYAGGGREPTSYGAVSTGRTGFAEAVRVVYDPSVISYRQLLEVFFTVAHDPTQLNRQGPDVGPQYRSALFFRSARQRQEAQAYVAALQRQRAFPGRIVTRMSTLDAFQEAEGYHQNYLVRHPTQPYIVHHDLPKLRNLQRRFPSLYRAPGPV